MKIIICRSISYIALFMINHSIIIVSITDEVEYTLRCFGFVLHFYNFVEQSIIQCLMNNEELNAI